MKTDDLLAALAADTLPRTSVTARLARALPVGLALSGLALALLWGFRSDLTDALASGAAAKTITPLVLTALAAPIALTLTRPDGATTVRPLVLFGVAALLLFGVVLGLGGLSALIAALVVPSLIVCFASIPLLALPLLAALLWALSAGAALNTTRTGVVAGLAAGGLSTALYSLYCDQDAVLFYLPAYGAAILVVGALGGLMGQRVLRW
jgi:hypothetical protein